MHLEFRHDPRFDVKPFAGIAWRTRCRREECRAREVRGLFDQTNERRGIVRDADHLQLVAFNPKFGRISVIRKNIRQRLKHNHAGWRLALALLQRRPRPKRPRLTPLRRIAARRSATRCNDVALLCIQSSRRQSGRPPSRAPSTVPPPPAPPSARAGCCRRRARLHLSAVKSQPESRCHRRVLKC